MTRYGMRSGHADNSTDILLMPLHSQLCHEQLHAVYEAPQSTPAMQSERAQVNLKDLTWAIYYCSLRLAFIHEARKSGKIRQEIHQYGLFKANAKQYDAGLYAKMRSPMELRLHIPSDTRE